jgi:two-component system phosphate regulon sensor histidine kinase PhoR
MTHEFKTPISSINISADVISNPDIIKTPERLKSYGAIIKQENNRLNKQVEKVLQIAGIEKSGFELKMEEVDLREIIDNVVSNCTSNNKLREARIVAKIESEDLIIQADRLHITNILHNLLDNAIKYADKQPEIKVSAIKSNKKIIIGVEDNGPGISREFQKRVFQKFFRIPTGNVHNVKGFGLGLYYVRNICRAHHWEISLESEAGNGSKFIIEIPV